MSADHEVSNAIGESCRDGRLVTLSASSKAELVELERAARQCVEDEGGKCPTGPSGHYSGAPGNGWRVRIVLDESGT
jgi:hypothetical protein